MKSAKINWTNSIYLVGLPIVTAVCLPWDILTNGLNLKILIFSIIYYGATGLGITAGYHRLFSHRAYESGAWVRAILLLLGAGALQNSALKWSMDHRRHHRDVDTDRDPYNVKRGFFWAHMGWIFYADSSDETNQAPRDLSQDRLVMIQHRYYLPIALFVSFGVPALVGWGLVGTAMGALTGLIWAGFLRVLMTSHCTFLINSAAHWMGTQPYTDTNTARDNFLLAIVTFGEGYHNFHHYFQFDYRNGVKWFQFDPTKWLIASLSGLRLARNLRTVSDAEILLAQAKMKELILKKAGVNTGYLSERLQVMVTLQKKFHEALREYKMAKRQQAMTRLEKIEIKYRMLEARAEFNLAYKRWIECWHAYRRMALTGASWG